MDTSSILRNKSKFNTLEPLTRYISRGYPLLPWVVIDERKVPLIKDWPNKASCDPEQIRVWSRTWPGCNWGALAGEKSGFVVVDVDNKNGKHGGLTLAFFLAQYGLDWLNTPTQFTPSGGYHIFLKYPIDRKVTKSTEGIGPGLDMIADGGWIALSPSKVGDKSYFWHTEKNLDALPLQPIPEWILAELRKPTPEMRPNNHLWSFPLSDEAHLAAQWLDNLSPWRCDNYEAWVEVGMALSQLGETGFLLWDTWSQKSPKYKRLEMLEKWSTFKPGTGITLGSLCHWAREDGGF